MSYLEHCAIRVYETRLAFRKAKDDLLQFRQEHGACMDTDDSDKHTDPCYSRYAVYDTGGENLRIEDWCEVCQGAQPLYKAYRKASTAKAVALRQLLTAVKILKEVEA